MTPITSQPAPATFARLVGTPGSTFLSRVSKPTSKEWASHDYWNRMAWDVYSLYGGVCSYFCHFIPTDTGGRSVDHFAPKSKYPHLAYDWTNYRLSSATANGRKSDHEDVVDPFLVQLGWFVLDFPAMVVRPGDNLGAATLSIVESSITRLQLNSDETCIKGRFRWLVQYCELAVHDEPRAFAILLRDAPFIARELDRQSLRGGAIIARVTF